MKSDAISPTGPNIPGFDSLPITNGIYFDAAVRRRLALKGDCPGASDYAVLAARQALEMSGLNRFRSELVIGAAFGSGMGDAQRWLYAREAGDLQDFIFRTADSVAADLELDGPTFEVSTACAASGYAIAMAATVLKSGEADVMVCGGAESQSFHALAAFNRLGALDDQSCRPFDVSRRGTLFGEGSAAIILELEDSFHNRRRTRAFAQLCGFGMSCDAHHPTAPAEDGAQIERAMRAALRGSGLDPTRISAIVPHATGTELNDLVESAVIERVFGRMDEQPWSIPVKAYAGHGGGMSGALSAVTAIMMINKRAVLSVPQSHRRDERCKVRLADKMLHDVDVEHVLVNAYAFGGNNVSLVFGRCK